MVPICVTRNLGKLFHWPGSTLAMGAAGMRWRLLGRAPGDLHISYVIQFDLPLPHEVEDRFYEAVAEVAPNRTAAQ